MGWPTLSLKNGNFIPMVSRYPVIRASGFLFDTFVKVGIWDRDCVVQRRSQCSHQPRAHRSAQNCLLKGFIHTDAANSYGTEREVEIAIKESGIPRDKLFITTKVLKGWKDVRVALNDSLQRLQVDYVDMYLLHNPYVIPTTVDIQTAWKGLETLHAEGKARNIGVSNFQRNHLDSCTDHCPLDLPLSTIAAKHNTSTSTVVLRWVIDQNVVGGTHPGDPYILSDMYNGSQSTRRWSILTFNTAHLEGCDSLLYTEYVE